MKTFTAAELKTVLADHKLWLETRWYSSPKGTCADLRSANLERADLRSANLYGANLYGADLYGANLYGANLYGADLYGANLYGADLRSANLYGANLYGANLYGADLYGADLRSANLERADLRSANLYGANLYGADLYGADLYGANLYGANLYGANLYGANLERADLRSANLRSAKLPSFSLVPDEGHFIGWKSVNYLGRKAVLKLRVEEAPRTSSLIGRKCRAQKVTVLAAYALDGKEIDPVTVFNSHHAGASFQYTVGKVVEDPEYDSDIRLECTKGIHFFITRKEAEEY